MTEPLITNARARREWQWIVSQVGIERATAALERLGNRKPYPLNIARLLGLKLPDALANEPALPQQTSGPPQEVQKRLNALRQRLRDKT